MMVAGALQVDSCLILNSRMNYTYSVRLRICKRVKKNPLKLRIGVCWWLLKKSGDETREKTGFCLFLYLSSFGLGCFFGKICKPSRICKLQIVIAAALKLIYGGMYVWWTRAFVLYQEYRENRLREGRERKTHANVYFWTCRGKNACTALAID